MKLSGAQVTQIEEVLARYDRLRRYIPRQMITEELVEDIFKIAMPEPLVFVQGQNADAAR